MTIPLYDSLFARHAGNTATFLHSDDGQVISYDAFLKRGAEIAHVLQKTEFPPATASSYTLKKLKMS